MVLKELTEEYYKNLLDNLHDGMLCVDSHKKIVFWNKSAEKLTGYTEKEVLGKIISDEVMAHFDENGKRLNEDQCYLQQVLDKGKSCKTDFYFQHKKGHFVPVSARISPIKDNRSKVSGAVQIFSDITTEIATQQAIIQLEKQAMIDPLTGLANRRYIDTVLDNKVDEVNRYGLTFGLLFIDIDHIGLAANDRPGLDGDFGARFGWLVDR